MHIFPNKKHIKKSNSLKHLWMYYQTFTFTDLIHYFFYNFCEVKYLEKAKKKIPCFYNGKHIDFNNI